MDIIIKRTGRKEDFDREKLCSSIYYPAREAEYSEDEADELAQEVCDAVIDWIDDMDEPVVTAPELRDHVIEELEDRDEDVAFLYRTHLDIN